MKHIATVFILLLYHASGFAQPGIRFSNTYKNNTDNNLRLDIVSTPFVIDRLNDRLYFNMYGVQLSPSLAIKTNWLKINLMGEEKLRVSDSVPDQNLCLVGSAALDNRTFLCGGFIINPSDTFSSWVVQKMDTNFNVIWRKVHDTKFTAAGIEEVLPIDDNSSILRGIIWRDSIGNYGAVHPNIRLIKIDSMGNTIWSKPVDSASWNNSKGLIRAHDGNLLVCGRSWAYGITDGGAFVMKIDTAGNELWHHSYDLPGYDGFEKMIATADGNYVCAGWAEVPPEISDMPNGAARMVKIDPSGNVIWDKVVNISPRDEWFRTLSESTNGDIVGFGGTYLNYAYDAYGYQVGNTGGPDGLAICVDKAGNEKWRRVFGNNAVPNCHDYLYQAAALPDGSYIATGTTHISDTALFTNGLEPYIRQVGWVVRMDSNGCVFQPCVDSVISISPVGALPGTISIYPNPAVSYVTVSSKEVFAADTRLQLTDMLGRRLLAPQDIGGRSSYRLSLDGLAAGTYLLVFETGGSRYYKKIALQP